MIAVYCLLSIVYCLLSIVYCLLSIVYCLLSIVSVNGRSRGQVIDSRDGSYGQFRGVFKS
jgi:hypothetical protein